MDKNNLVFDKINYILMLAGILLLIIGFFVMTLDKEEYGFGALGLTVGPVIVLIGFIVEFFAIFYKPKKTE
jgi:hypothetical protein